MEEEEFITAIVFREVKTMGKEIRLKLDESLEGKIMLMEDCFCHRTYRPFRRYFKGGGTIRVIEPIDDPLMERLFILSVWITLHDRRGKQLYDGHVHIVGKKLNTSDMVWNCRIPLRDSLFMPRIAYADLSLLHTMNIFSNEREVNDETARLYISDEW